LNIDAVWSKPIELLDGGRDGLIYRIGDLQGIPDSPGAYVFARLFGENVTPLYIGETTTLRSRLNQHLNMNLRLMKGIENAANGKRVFLFCEVHLRRGQKINQVLKVLQSALIEHALSEGHKLLNVQLARTPVHTINFRGNRHSEQLAPRQMYHRA
jgi:hypothetical protein